MACQLLPWCCSLPRTSNSGLESPAMCQSRRPHTPAVRQPHAPFPAAAAVQVALQQLQPEDRAGVHGFVRICALLRQSGGPRSRSGSEPERTNPAPR